MFVPIPDLTTKLFTIRFPSVCSYGFERVNQRPVPLEGTPQKHKGNGKQGNK